MRWRGNKDERRRYARVDTAASLQSRLRNVQLLFKQRPQLDCVSQPFVVHTR